MKIAVITACFNGGKFIADCVNSVQALHTFGEFELEHIIVDDASTDNSWIAISSFNFANLKKFRLEKNEGPSAARNFAISKTDAEYIFCLDADDVIFQNSVHYLFLTLKQNHSEWVYGDFIRGDEELRYERGNDYYGYQFKTPEETLTSMYAGSHFFQHSSMFSKNLFERTGGYDKNLRMGEDFDLFTRFLIAGVLPHYTAGALFMHRNHPASASVKHRNDPDLHKKDIIKFFKKYEKELSARGINQAGRCA